MSTFGVWDQAAHQHNWRVSFPEEVIYLALADIITACFCNITACFRASCRSMCHWQHNSREYNCWQDFKAEETHLNRPQITPFSQYLQLCQPSTGAPCSLQPSHKLVSLLLKILLTGNCPDLKQILKLRPQDLGKLSIWTLRKSIASKILAVANQDTRESSHVSWSNLCLITTPDPPRSVDTSNPLTFCSNFVTLTPPPTYRTTQTCVQRYLLREKKRISASLGNEVPYIAKFIALFSIKR